MAEPTLQYGSRGHAVRVMQQLVSEALGANPGLVRDGAFGPLTDAATHRFQRAHGLEDDGVAGPLTWAALWRARGFHQMAAQAKARAAASAAEPAQNALPPAKPPTGTPPPAARSGGVAAASPPRAQPVHPMTPSERSEVDLLDIAAEPPWYKIAVAEYDLHKTIQHTADGDQRIHEYFRATSYHPALGTSASWCAAFVNWCLNRAGVSGDNNAGAGNFMQWGIELSKPRPGCIMVIHWTHYAKGDSGNHVTFFHHDAGNQL